MCVPSTQQYVVSYLGNAQRRRALCRDHCIACPRVRVWGYCNCECGCHPRTTHCTATTTTSYRQLCIRGTAKILSQHNQWARIDTIEWSHIDKLQLDTHANHDTPMTTDNSYQPDSLQFARQESSKQNKNKCLLDTFTKFVCL